MHGALVFNRESLSRSDKALKEQAPGVWRCRITGGNLESMSDQPLTGCGCPPTAPPRVSSGGVHHVFLTVNKLARSKEFYAALMPRLGYPTIWEFPGGLSVGWISPGGSFWIKQAASEFGGDRFSKDRVGLCEVAFRAEDRDQIDAL